MSEYPKSVVDEDGNVHDLVMPPLGRGGQGVVFRTRSPSIAVKLLAHPGAPLEPAPQGSRPRETAAARLWSRLTDTRGTLLVNDEAGQQALRRRLEDVRLLPLRDLHLARPLSVLRGHLGYTMCLLTGMVPIRSLVDETGKDLAETYRATGSVGRRLSLLAGAAELLSRLHAVPLAYADVSPNNVFVSEAKGAAEVWLIDADNLDYLSKKGPSIYTPGFGAPEVVTGRSGVTTLSDAYSFAVLAFWVLAQCHPFLGDYVEEGGWDDDEDREKREEKAYHGQLPWIEDEADPSNRTSRGVPRDLVLSKPLRDLFARAFGPGRTDRTQRPGMAEWAEALRRAADRVITCHACGSSFDVTRRACGFCAQRPEPAFLYMQVNLWDPEIDASEARAASERPVWHKTIDARAGGTVMRHVIEPVPTGGDDPGVLRVRVDARGMVVEPLGDREIHVVEGGRRERLVRERRLAMPVQGNEVYLHFGALDRPHRLATLRHFPGGA